MTFDVAKTLEVLKEFLLDFRLNLAVCIVSGTASFLPGRSLGTVSVPPLEKSFPGLHSLAFYLFLFSLSVAVLDGLFRLRHGPRAIVEAWKSAREDLGKDETRIHCLAVALSSASSYDKWHVKELCKSNLSVISGDDLYGAARLLVHLGLLHDTGFGANGRRVYQVSPLLHEVQKRHPWVFQDVPEPRGGELPFFTK